MVTHVNSAKRKLVIFLLVYTGIAAITTLYLIIAGRIGQAGIPMISGMGAMAILGWIDKRYKGFSFTSWVFAFLAAGMYYPFLFTDWGFDTTILVIPLLQLIMFGMGTKLSLADFGREIRQPKGFIAGMVMVFTVMPLLGLMVAKLFRFPPEIAAGVILIGACPGGAASNVMTYLARGNVALSVSITTIATFITPVVTPALMALLADQFIKVSFLEMMMSSFNIIIVPISAGLLCNRILYAKVAWLQESRWLLVIGFGAFISGWLVSQIPMPETMNVLRSGIVLGLALTGLVATTKLLMEIVKGPKDFMSTILPKISMLSIIIFVTIVVAHNQETLLVVGLMLVAASAVHNIMGYFFGYWGARLMGLSIQDCRTLSIEVALKNGGLGMGLALDALGSSNAALAPIVFGKWMNISASAIANWWRERPVEVKEASVVKE